jgi:hypothetical protein
VFAILWFVLASSSAGRRRSDGPADATHRKELQYWWLLPGDLGYSVAPSPPDPKIE